jgi:hypothetical protein
LLLRRRDLSSEARARYQEKRKLHIAIQREQRLHYEANIDKALENPAKVGMCLLYIYIFVVVFYVVVLTIHMDVMYYVVCFHLHRCF